MSLSSTSSHDAMLETVRQANDDIVTLRNMMDTFVSKLEETTERVRQVETLIDRRREIQKKQAKKQQSTNLEEQNAQQMRLTQEQFPSVEKWMVDIGTVKLGTDEHSMLEEKKVVEESVKTEHGRDDEETKESRPPPTTTSPKIEFLSW